MKKGFMGKCSINLTSKVFMEVECYFHPVGFSTTIFALSAFAYSEMVSPIPKYVSSVLGYIIVAMIL